MMTQRTNARIGRSALMMLALAMIAGPIAAAPITVVDDDFESPTYTAGNSPAGTSGFTVAATSADQTVLVVDNEQSSFGEIGDTQAVRLDDNDNSSTLFSQRLENDTPLPTNKDLIIQFDYKLNSLSQNPTFALLGPEGTGIGFGLAYPDATHEIYYADGSNTRIHLDTAVQNQWYRATLHVNRLDSAIDSWDLRLQRHDGSSVVSDQTFTDLDFRLDITEFTRLRWVFNTVPSQHGDLVVDNMLIQIVPTPAALPAGLAMLGMLVMRRK